MKTVSVEYAVGHLSELIEEVAAGEQILIVGAQGPMARLLAPAPVPGDQEQAGPEAPDEEVEPAFYGD